MLHFVQKVKVSSKMFIRLIGATRELTNAYIDLEQIFREWIIKGVNNSSVGKKRKCIYGIFVMDVDDSV